jgi:hypothetical protein
LERGLQKDELDDLLATGRAGKFDAGPFAELVVDVEGTTEGG